MSAALKAGRHWLAGDLALATLLANPDLSAIELRVLLTMIVHGDAADTCHMGSTAMGRASATPDRSCRRAMQRLVDAGWVGKLHGDNEPPRWNTTVAQERAAAPARSLHEGVIPNGGHSGRPPRFAAPQRLDATPATVAAPRACAREVGISPSERVVPDLDSDSLVVEAPPKNSRSERDRPTASGRAAAAPLLAVEDYHPSPARIAEIEAAFPTVDWRHVLRGQLVPKREEELRTRGDWNRTLWGWCRSEAERQAGTGKAQGEATGAAVVPANTAADWLRRWRAAKQEPAMSRRRLAAELEAACPEAFHQVAGEVAEVRELAAELEARWRRRDSGG